jgi:signal transduction histidine kinase
LTLSASPALLRALLDGIDTPALILAADSLRILMTNRAAARRLDIAIPDLRGADLASFVRPADILDLQSHLAALPPKSTRWHALPVEFRNSDGSRFACTLQVRQVVSGAPALLVCRLDCEASASARAAGDRDLHRLLAHIPGMAYQLAPGPAGKSRLLYVSEQARPLLGLSPASLQNDPALFSTLILDEDKPDYLARMAESGNGHLGFNWEGRIWIEAWKDVKWVNLRVRRRPGNTAGLYDGIMLNVTHTKLAQAEIRRSRAQLRAMASHAEAVREAERLAIAREIHDDLGGNLTAIKIGLSWLMRNLPEGDPRLHQRAQYLDQVVDQSMDTTHRIASSLRPPVLDFGIVAAIDWYLHRFADNSELQASLQAPQTPVHLPAEAAISVFRIVQEALTNVAKHAQARHVVVALALADDGLQVSITDDGRGLPAHRERQGYGLLGMAERATALGGALCILPAEPRGTRVSLRIPLIGQTADSPK